MLASLVQINHYISKYLEFIGFIALVFIMTITCLDVIGAKVFQHPIFGSLDMVMMSQLLAISFAATSTLIEGRHVRVDFIVDRLPGLLRALVNALINLAGTGLFVLISWQLFALGHHLQTGHEVTPTAHIPLCIFAYAAAVASIPVAAEYLLSAVAAGSTSRRAKP